jgi:hypothetical protein
MVIEVEDQLSFVSRVVLTEKDYRGEELSRRDVLVELRGLSFES